MELENRSDKSFLVCQFNLVISIFKNMSLK